MSGVDYSEFLKSYAKLKKIPLAEVIHNATKDFVQAALRETPTASEKGVLWYRAKKGGHTWYIPASRVNSRRREQLEKGNIAFEPLPIKKGWSKATWLGAMQALGMNTGKAKVPKFASLLAKFNGDVKTLSESQLQSEAEKKSAVAFAHTASSASAVITDEFRIDCFGRGSSSYQFNRISAAGFALAATRITNDYARHIREAWKK